MPEDKIKCFVIMPFSKTTNEHKEDYWTNHFNTFLKPLIEEDTTVEAHRSTPMRGDILKQIINDLVVDPIVVADLTDKNENVYWELGVRQSFKHGTITIAEEGTRLPFDIITKGTIFYNLKDDLKRKVFNKQFKEAIQDCVRHPEKTDSHVLETLSGRGTLFETFHRDETIRRLNAVISECDSNLSSIEYIINGAKQNQGLINRLSSIIKGKKFSPARLKTLSIELLITQRYLEADEEFYKFAESYYNWIIIMDGLLLGEEVDRSTKDKWILHNGNAIRYAVGWIKQYIERSRDKVRNRL